ncbi:hypothetical protein EDEG_00552 [Edhazardia aedis USNM 41457]|uniref:Uncharacterized protein n=1 Tax=Edhazardia aedis (strain USNM 41457) TaxID=1003232 RepID=J9D0W7_EDHAE|nr:hypothetical protein EDEG_00552 [Edhazardia aedis USNM 41457]|eukprot:EJW01219.1 hypothetical protein EDEG_00552 [Edhazardia aedis USNM 41457]
MIYLYMLGLLKISVKNSKRKCFFRMLGLTSFFLLVAAISDLITSIFIFFYSIKYNIIIVTLLITIWLCRIFNFELTYRKINRRNVIITKISILLSFMMELISGYKSFSCWFRPNTGLVAIPGMIWFLIDLVLFTFKILILVNLYFMWRIVRSGREVEVRTIEGGIRGKIDDIGNNLPFL